MTEPEVSFNERLSRRDLRRAAVLVGACLAVVVAAAVTMGASPSASPAAPGASASPDASGDPGKAGDSWWGGHLDGRGRFGGVGLGGISITGIDGSSLALATEDGWTRTIAVTSATTITKAGQSIAVGDLAVGDQIRFRQTRGTDGSFSVTAIAVVLPSVAGTVTATSPTTITITRRDGTTQTLNVNSATTYEVAGVTDADLDDIVAGLRLKAVGEENADGSFDASAVRAGHVRLRGAWDHGKPGQPDPSASPSPTG